MTSPSAVVELPEAVEMAVAEPAVLADPALLAVEPRGRRLDERARRRLAVLGLGAVISLYGALAIVFNLATPLYEGFDEPHHAAYVMYIRGAHRFPVLPSSLFEGNQPPAYYFLLAAETKVLHLPDPAPAIEARPPGPGPAKFDHGAIDTCTFCDGVRAIRMYRLTSTLFAALTLLAGFLLALRIFPGRALIAVATAATMAFIPQFAYVNSLVNNDSLSNLSSALVLLGLVGIVTASGPVARQRWAALTGLAVGLGLITKEYVLPLLPLIPLAFVLARPGWRQALTGLGIVGGLALLVGGWFLAWNLVHYGQPWPFRAELADMERLFPPQVQPRSIGDPMFRGPFLAELQATFWYSGGWGQVRADQGLYLALFLWQLVLGVGAIGVLSNPARLGLSPAQLKCLWLLLAAIGLQLGGIVYHNLTISQAQGRYLFPVLPAIALFMVLGASFLVPRAARRPAYLAVPVAGLACTLFVLVTTVLPAYRA